MHICAIEVQEYPHPNHTLYIKNKNNIWPNSCYHPMVVSHNNLLTLIGQDSVASCSGSSVGLALSTISRSLLVVVVSTLGTTLISNTTRWTASLAAITQTTLHITSRRSSIAPQHPCGLLSLGLRAVRSFNDGGLIQGFNSSNHAPPRGRFSTACARVTHSWVSSIAVSLRAAYRKASAETG